MFPLRRRLQRLALRRGGGWGACLACFARPLVDRSQRVVDKPANRKLALKSRLPTAQNKTSCRAMGCDSIKNKYLVQFLCTVSLTLSERSPAMLVLIPLYHGNDDIKTQRRPVLIIRRLSPPSSPIFFDSLPTPSSPDSPNVQDRSTQNLCRMRVLYIGQGWPFGRLDVISGKNATKTRGGAT